MKKIISIILIGISVILASYFFYSYYNNQTINVQNTQNINDNKDNVNLNKTKVIAIGDSLTAGYGLSLDESYPKQLEKKLLESSYNVEIINAGISGETTAGLLERMEFIKSQKPEIVLITIGGNDALRATRLEVTKDNIYKIIQQLKSGDNKIAANKIFLMQIQAPQNLGINYVKNFNDMYSEIAKKEKINLVPFVVPEVFLNNNYMQDDGIHPNKDGYKYIVDEYAYKALVKSLQN